MTIRDRWEALFRNERFRSDFHRLSKPFSIDSIGDTEIQAIDARKKQASLDSLPDPSLIPAILAKKDGRLPFGIFNCIQNAVRAKPEVVKNGDSIVLNFLPGTDLELTINLASPLTTEELIKAAGEYIRAFRPLVRKRRANPRTSPQRDHWEIYDKLGKNPSSKAFRTLAASYCTDRNDPVVMKNTVQQLKYAHEKATSMIAKIYPLQ